MLLPWIGEPWRNEKGGLVESSPHLGSESYLLFSCCLKQVLNFVFPVPGGLVEVQLL